MPTGYVSVAKRGLMKLVKKMNRKQIKAEHIFMMKDSDVVSSQDFIQFIDRTLNLNLKKREQHALVSLCDTNKNNTIAKEEFLALVKKGEKLLEAEPNQPMKDNFLAATDDIDEAVEIDNKTKRSTKPSLNRAETSVVYAGDAKSQIIKIITSSPHLSIEDYFEKECKWKENELITFEILKANSDKLFDVPAKDLKTLFDE